VLSTRVDFIELHILHHANEEPLYGLWMIEELARHGYRLGSSQLYPRFHRLEKLGYLRRQARVVEGRRRKYYRTTPAGRRYLNEQKRRVIELMKEAFSPAELVRDLDPKARRRTRSTPTTNPTRRSAS